MSLRILGASLVVVLFWSDAATPRAHEKFFLERRSWNEKILQKQARESVQDATPLEANKKLEDSTDKLVDQVLKTWAIHDTELDNMTAARLLGIQDMSRSRPATGHVASYISHWSRTLLSNSQSMCPTPNLKLRIPVYCPSAFLRYAPQYAPAYAPNYSATDHVVPAIAVAEAASAAAIRAAAAAEILHYPNGLPASNYTKDVEVTSMPKQGIAITGGQDFIEQIRFIRRSLFSALQSPDDDGGEGHASKPQARKVDVLKRRFGKEERPSERAKAKTFSRSILWRMLEEVRPQLALTITATTFLLGATLLELQSPRYWGLILDCVSNPAPGDQAHLTLLRRFLEMLAIYQCRAALSFAHKVLFAFAGDRLVARLRTSLFKGILRQHITFFDKTRTGELISRLSSDVAVLRSALTRDLSSFLKDLVTFIVGSVFLFQTSWQLSVLTLIAVPPIALSMNFFGRQAMQLSKRAQDALALATTEAQEAITCVRTVRAFSSERHHEKAFAETINETLVILSRAAVISAGFRSGVTAVFGAVIASIFYFGGSLVLRGDMSSGTLLTYVFYCINVNYAIEGLADVSEQVMKSAGAANRVFELIDAPGTQSGTLPLAKHPQGCVKFRNVSFAYPTRPGDLVLKSVSFELAPSSTVALVGPSGSGKSTVTSLLLKLYTQQSGDILIDGIPVRDIDPVELHKHMAVVSQEPVLFADTIARNIAYGLDGEVTQEQIEEVAKLANCAEFVERLPHGYNTLVGEQGVLLSGGQKQRVAIARALLRKPAILLLDEATSALDAETEHLVHEALEKLMAQGAATTLVIAHRLSTVRSASRVLVLDHGKLVGSGSHEFLLKRCDTYRKLVARQLDSGIWGRYRSKKSLRKRNSTNKDIEESNMNPIVDQAPYTLLSQKGRNGGFIKSRIPVTIPKKVGR